MLLGLNTSCLAGPSYPDRKVIFCHIIKKHKEEKAPGPHSFVLLCSSCPPKHHFNLYSLEGVYIFGVIGKGPLGKRRISRGGKEVGESNRAK